MMDGHSSGDLTPEGDAGALVRVYRSWLTKHDRKVSERGPVD